MRARPVVVFALLWLLGAGVACAEEQYYLAHVANGSFGDGSYRTTFVFFNNTDAELKVLLKLTKDNGDPLTVTLGGLGARSQFEIFIGAGATHVLQTDGLGAVVTGAATVSAPAKIGVSAIFGIYDAVGRFVTEAGVGSSVPLTEFVLPVDTTGLFNTGLALLNTGSVPAAITMMLRDTDGRVVDQTALNLGGNAHIARFVSGASELFPSVSGFRGTLWVRSSSPVAALVLRQNQPPVSYTSLPVVPASSTQLAQNLAQVVNGSFGAGSYKTSFLLFNLTGNAADVALSLTTDDGSPFSVSIPGRGTSGAFNISLPAFGSVFLQTDGSGLMTQGAAAILSTTPVGASAIFTVLDQQGAFQTEAGVGDSPVMTALTLPVDITAGSDAGVAFFNPASVAATITLKLLDSSGALLDSGTTIVLGAKGHTASFVSQLFPGTTYYQGSLAVVASSGVAALTLRQNSVPLSYTTLPVVAGTSSGKAPPAPLLSRTQTGITATGILAVDETLPYGFRLTGHIAGRVRILQITARRADGSASLGEADPDTGRYLIPVDRGSYTLQVCYQPLDAGGVTLTYSDPSPVRVDDNTTRNITLPSVPMFSVTGRVSGLSGLPEATNAGVVFTSDDNAIEGVFPAGADGNYQGYLPNGSYRAGVVVPLVILTPFQNEALALYNLGSAGVNSGPASASLSIPLTARVSGTVRASWLGTLAFGIRIFASDSSAPPASAFDYISPPALSIANADPSGQYQMVLARDRTYALSASVPLLDGSRRLGTITYPLAPDPLVLGGDTTNSFNLPDLPSTVTVSGRVLDSQGRAVSGAAVVADTQTVTGAPGVGYSATAITDDQGNYSMTVLSGTAYRLQFLPGIR